MRKGRGPLKTQRYLGVTVGGTKFAIVRQGKESGDGRCHEKHKAKGEKNGGLIVRTITKRRCLQTNGGES